MRIAGAIIAGGDASRLGGEKPFTPFAGGTLLDAVLARLAPQTDIMALNLRTDAAETAHLRYSLTILLDAPGDPGGPLAGIVAALSWAKALGDVAWLATAPADTPFLPEDLVSQLKAAAREGTPVYARDSERAHYLCALWPVTALAPLRAGFEGGAFRSLHRALTALGAVECRIDAPPLAFFNVNTAADLSQAEAHLNR